MGFFSGYSVFPFIPWDVWNWIFALPSPRSDGTQGVLFSYAFSCIFIVLFPPASFSSSFFSFWRHLLLRHTTYVTPFFFIISVILVPFSFRQPPTSNWHEVRWINWVFFSSVFLLYVACKTRLPRKCARFVLFRPIKKCPFNLLCVLDLFSEHWQSTLFQIFFFFAWAPIPHRKTISKG